jgi:hypothetical protein
MFVEVPSDIGSDEEAHERFLEEQAAIYKAQLVKKRSSKKRQKPSSPSEDEEEEGRMSDGEGSTILVFTTFAEGDINYGDELQDDDDDDDEVDNQGNDEDEVNNQDEVEDEGEDEERDELKKQLLGARFRLLNEQLYSIPSTEAVELFEEHPELFEVKSKENTLCFSKWFDICCVQVYHAGFAEQVSKWPTNPVDAIIQWLKAKPTSLVVADFGCGDAKLASQAKQKTIHSFDLVAANARVTACDMAHVPLENCTVDVAVFCLSLMGSNAEDFVREAHRVLRVGGTLLVAEVSSRLSDWSVFVNAVKKLGFDGGFDKHAKKNSHFVQFHFTKNAKAPSVKPVGIKLGVCKYKKR